MKRLGWDRSDDYLPIDAVECCVSDNACLIPTLPLLPVTLLFFDSFATISNGIPGIVEGSKEEQWQEEEE